MPSIAQLEAQAEAQDELNKINTSIRDDVLNGETKTGLGSLGLGASPVAATNDANKYVTLYHAYDGRAVPVPLYMLNQMNSLLAHRFAFDNDIPPEYRGQRVWSAKRPEHFEEPKPYLCLLSVEQPDEIKEQMARAGMQSNCRKPARFATDFEADYHFKRKHPRRYEAYQRYLDRSQAAAQSDQITKLAQAILATKEG